MQSDHLPRYTAESIARVHVVGYHVVAYVSGNRKACSAAARLQGKALLEVTAVDDNARRRLGKQQVVRVGRKASCPAADFRRVAYRVHLYYIVHVMLGYGKGRVGITDNIVRQYYYLFCVARVNHGVAQGAAHRFFVPVAAVTVGVSHRVAAARAEKGNVYFQVAVLYRRRPAAVRAEQHRLLHESVAHRVRKLSAQTARVDFCNHAVFDVLDKRRVNVGKTARRNGEIFEAHFCKLVDDKIHDVVALAEMVVEGYGHAVFQSACPDCLFKRNHLFAGPLQLVSRIEAARSDAFVPIFAVKWHIVFFKQFLGNFVVLFFFHFSAPVNPQRYAPRAQARACAPLSKLPACQSFFR